ncbi:regulatory protein RecX [Legionella sp. W05-934-2]|jgi:regulatory protein|uniref:regulatory protein RecX n=1 Tax=Legionella sp. W05-934-2 TaxID=1198649 RepID=UPI00346182A5
MSKAFEQAVQLLARRAHSCHELKIKLASQGFSDTEIEQAIIQCQQKGYQSDDQFVEHYARYRVGQGDGPLKIRHALQQKGIASDLIRNHLSTIDWYEQAIMVYGKKFAHAGSDINDFKTRQKQMRFMQSRGFDAEVIRACFVNQED